MFILSFMLCLCVHHWKVGGPVFVCPPLESGYIPVHVVVYGIMFCSIATCMQHCVYYIISIIYLYTV